MGWHTKRARLHPLLQRFTVGRLALQRDRTQVCKGLRIKWEFGLFIFGLSGTHLYFPIDSATGTIFQSTCRTQRGAPLTWNWVPPNWVRNESKRQWRKTVVFSQLRSRVWSKTETKNLQYWPNFNSEANENPTMKAIGTKKDGFHVPLFKQNKGACQRRGRVAIHAGEYFRGWERGLCLGQWHRQQQRTQRKERQGLRKAVPLLAARPKIHKHGNNCGPEPERRNGPKTVEGCDEYAYHIPFTLYATSVHQGKGTEYPR